MSNPAATDAWFADHDAWSRAVEVEADERGAYAVVEG